MKYSLFIFSMIIFFACGSEKKEQEKLYDEVMEIHDAVMPKMAEINRIKRTLKKALEKGESSVLSENVPEKIFKTITQLQKANDGMMDWMHDFKQPTDIPHQEAIDYLTGQKEMISKVSTQMLESIKDGNELLKELNLTN